jgi:hypothetical protein
MSETEHVVSIQEKFKLYIALQKEIKSFRIKQAEQKKVLQTLEADIQEYMLDQGLDNISLADGDIIIYQRKTNQAMKKPAMTEKIAEKLKCTDEKAEELAEALLGNKIFVVENKIKANIKKTKK